MWGASKGGYLTYIERLGNVVKSGGENVSLSKVTRKLKSVFGDDFDDVVAVAIPDNYWGSMVVALIRSSDKDQTLDREELRDRCRSVLARYEIPQHFIRFGSGWPVSPEGKLHVKKLQEFAAEAVFNPRPEYHETEGAERS